MSPRGRVGTDTHILVHFYFYFYIFVFLMSGFGLLFSEGSGKYHW